MTIAQNNVVFTSIETTKTVPILTNDHYNDDLKASKKSQRINTLERLWINIILCKQW